jgi:hypothetical protein
VRQPCEDVLRSAKPSSACPVAPLPPRKESARSAATHWSLAGWGGVLVVVGVLVEAVVVEAVVVALLEMRVTVRVTVVRAPLSPDVWVLEPHAASRQDSASAHSNVRARTGPLVRVGMHLILARRRH